MSLLFDIKLIFFEGDSIQDAIEANKYTEKQIASCLSKYYVAGTFERRSLRLPDLKENQKCILSFRSEGETTVYVPLIGVFNGEQFRYSTMSKIVTASIFHTTDLVTDYNKEKIEALKSGDTLTEEEYIAKRYA